MVALETCGVECDYLKSNKNERIDQMALSHPKAHSSTLEEHFFPTILP